MRRFVLINDPGEHKSLLEDVFLYAPSGLGFQNDNEYSEKDGFFIKTADKAAQVGVQGTLIFRDMNKYTQYHDFFDWILNTKKLTLGYAPDATYYFVDVDILSVEKSEITPDNLLEVPITFAPTTPWYSTLPYEVAIQGRITGNIKRYNYRYDYVYSSQTKPAEVSFVLDSQMPGDMEIDLIGPISAPVISAYDQAGDLIGRVDLSESSVVTGETLSFSSRGNDSHVVKITPTGTVDIINELQLTAGVSTFFKIPAKTEVRLTLSAADLTDAKAFLKIYRYYRTV